MTYCVEFLQRITVLGLGLIRRKVLEKETGIRNRVRTLQKWAPIILTRSFILLISFTLGMGADQKYNTYIEILCIINFSVLGIESSFTLSVHFMVQGRGTSFQVRNCTISNSNNLFHR